MTVPPLATGRSPTRLGFGPSAFSRFAGALAAISAAPSEAEVAAQAFAAAQALVGGDDIILCEIAVGGGSGPSRRAVLSGGGTFGGLAGLCTACDGRNPLARAIRGALVDGGLQLVDGLRAQALPLDRERSLALAWVDNGAPAHDAEAGLALLLAQVRAAHERLRRAARPSRALAAAGLAHDVANLLQVVHAGVDELSERCAADPEAVALCGELSQTAVRADRLLRELRALGKPRVEGPPTALAEAVPAACGDAALLLQGRRLLQPAALPDALVPMQASALERAVLNLLKNAILAVPAGGTIALEASVVDCLQPRPLPRLPDLAPGKWLALSVKDDGPGVGAHLLDRIGAPFVTTRADTGGSGLGLAVTRGLAAAAGGALSVDSVEGRGFAATLWLPVVGTATRPAQLVWSVGADAPAAGAPISLEAAVHSALRPGGPRPGLIFVDESVSAQDSARLGALCPTASMVRLEGAQGVDRDRRVAAALDGLALEAAAGA